MINHNFSEIELDQQDLFYYMRNLRL